MGAVLINVGDCAKRGIRLVLKKIFKIESELTLRFDMNVMSEPHVYAPDECFAALVLFHHKEVEAYGFVLLYLSKPIAKKIVTEASGDVSDPVILRLISEAVNFVAYMLEAETIRLQLGNLQMDDAQAFPNGIDRKLENMDVLEEKYTVVVEDDIQKLMTFEVAFSGRKRLKEAGDFKKRLEDKK